MRNSFDEWPLVVFTTLAILGAGLLMAPLIAVLVGPAAAAGAGLLLPGAALLAAGLVVSLAHLGQPQRAPLALARAGRSRLSTEILLASAALAAGALAAVFPYWSPVTTLLPAVLALGFLVTLGLVYNLPGQLAWRGSIAASPVVLGVGFGALALGANDGSFASVAPVAAICLATDVVLFLVRRRRTGGAAAVPAFRFLLVDVLPGCLILAGLPKGAAGALGLGILLDRLSFYLSAAQHTTEAEIARIEDLISDMS